MDNDLATNKRHVLVIGAIFAALVFFAALIVAFLISQSLWSIVFAALVAAVATVVAWRKADSVVLDLCDARDASPETEPRFFNVVNGLRVAMGLAPIALYVIEDDAMNAIAVGRHTHDAALCVTSGLLENLELIEFEAVIALELHKIRTREIAPQTFVVTTLGLPLVLAERFDNVSWLANLFRLFTPLVDSALSHLANPQLDLERDVEAMSHTRYPPALGDALEKIAGHSALAIAAPVTAHLWMAPALAPSANPRINQLHAQLKDRVSVLQEL